ncbi:MAG TPA: glycosyltransferase [Saprospiraceae bacterium]|nr:glycosyltransferase [Saprospiraceae bacterium]
MPLSQKETKHIVLISYYWPPSGGVGVRRWLYLSKHLADMGYQITVFHPKNADYTQKDEALIEDIHPGIQTIAIPIFEIRKLLDFLPISNKKSKESILSNTSEHQSRLTRLLLYVRSNFYIPDARVGWLRPLNRALKNYLKENHCDVLITTGPPHSVHLAGLKMKQLFPDLIWMADFRDPWTRIEYFEHLLLQPKARKRHLKLEREVVKGCDILITVSPSWRKDFEEMGAKNVRVITNAYDFRPAEYTSLAERKEELFIISHAGTVNEDRLPLGLLSAVQQLVQVQAAIRDKIRLEFIGNSSHKILETARKMGIEDLVTLEGFLPHKQLMERLKRSRLLLVLINKSELNQKGRIPAKLFEYIGLRKKIMLLSPGPNDAADLIEQHDLGDAFNYKDVKAQKEFLKKTISLSHTYQPDSNTINSFHRSARAKEVDQIIGQLLAGKD